MNEVRRPGFDGSYLGDRRRGLAWLVIDGSLYTLDKSAARSLLEDGAEPVEAAELVAEMPIGGAIQSGSALVRSDASSPIHLFAVDRPENRLHRVVSWETFKDFGFDLAKVMLVPGALLQPVPSGVELWSARDRLARKGHSMYLPLLEVLD